MFNGSKKRIKNVVVLKFSEPQATNAAWVATRGGTTFETHEIESIADLGTK